MIDLDAFEGMLFWSPELDDTGLDLDALHDLVDEVRAHRAGREIEQRALANALEILGRVRDLVAGFRRSSDAFDGVGFHGAAEAYWECARRLEGVLNG